MAFSSLFALVDDIATVLDDVALMTKVAAKKTAGVLGDDLALNAEQVTGVRADRELPVVWAVAKGSFKNKLILVPAALLISAIIPWLITPLLMIGGGYLCFEGFEKVAHKLFAHDEVAHKDQLRQARQDPETDLVAVEKEKIKGAIRTDFILSAEIIVIALGTVQEASFAYQAAVVSLIATVMTIGVYGLVAGIVRLDDVGLALVQSQAKSAWNGFKHKLGNAILWFAPALMKTLSFVGTIAMFLVGGSILLHGIPGTHDLIHHAEELAHSVPAIGGVLSAITPLLSDALTGVLAGGLILLIVNTFTKLTNKKSVAH